jgi:hypothetical protein
VHRQDDEISLTGLSDGSGGSAWAELGDQLSQGVRPSAVAEDHFVTGPEGVAGDGLGQRPGSNHSEFHVSLLSGPDPPKWRDLLSVGRRGVAK